MTVMHCLLHAHCTAQPPFLPRMLESGLSSKVKGQDMKNDPSRLAGELAGSRRS